MPDAPPPARAPAQKTSALVRVGSVLRMAVWVAWMRWGRKVASST